MKCWNKLIRRKNERIYNPSKSWEFQSKKIDSIGEIIDGSIAYIDLNGGGPKEKHTHKHNHLFIVTKGETKIVLDNEEVIVEKDEAFLVDGEIPHSFWNNIDSETIMIGISVKKRKVSLKKLT